ncbi:hypothetical protein MSAN_01100500 [Mycena sanguinolenta]|uniref:Uncharacterized protein n=1 Tax=Mycena sanguinolenta TaxID=230812 RepID=A0A8H6YNJ0_9AGAR|nr:hypothetical protein MSAN_01100500 [Mycena sanguinolenta]
MSIEVDLDDPRLPPELEHRIFEIAALARPTRIPILMLVARRVRCWVEPLLYRVVFLRGQHDHPSHQFPLPIFSVDAPERKSYQCFRHVRNLFISSSIEETAVKSWLLACPNTTNLYAMFDLTPEVLPCLSGFTNIRYLTIEASALDGNSSLFPLFLSVTHLELLNSAVDADRVCANVALIPRLTHIALNPHLPSRLSHAEFSAIAQLQCIVFLSAGILLDGSPLLDDARFVCIEEELHYTIDWLQGAISGDDYWALADAFLAARRAGKTDRTYPRLTINSRC